MRVFPFRSSVCDFSHLADCKTTTTPTITSTTKTTTTSATTTTATTTEACNELEQITRSTSYACPGGPENSSSPWCKTFLATNVLSLDVDNWDGMVTNGIPDHPGNYWLAELRLSGPDQGFTMFLGCAKTIVGLTLRNTHNSLAQNCSTKKFRILGSSESNGPWQELLVADLEDSRHQEVPLPLQYLSLDTPVTVSYIKFELLEFWGVCGGLQYLAVEEV